MGNGLSQLTEEQIKNLKENTTFDERAIAKIIKRYAEFDETETGTTGLTLQDVASIPEFSGHVMAVAVAKQFMDKEIQRLFPENFIYFIAALSSKSNMELKRDLTFKVLDTNNKGYLDYQDIYNMYHLFCGGALPRDQLLIMTHRALNHPTLHEHGKINHDEFDKLVPDWEIQPKMTVNLQNVTE